MDRPGRWLRELGPALALGFVAVMGTRGVDGQDATTDVDAVGWALLVVTVLVTAARRRAPLTTLAVSGLACATYLVLGYPYGPVLLGVALATYAAARRAPLRAGLGVAAVVLLALWVHLLVRDPTTPVGAQPLDGWLGLLPGSAWVVVPFAVGYALRVREEMAARSRAHTLAEQVAAERLRLSQEVHDVVGHGLAAIKMQADVALHVGAGGGHAAATPALEAISASAGAALHELRDVLGQVRDGGDRAPSRGLSDLGALADRVRGTGVDIAVQVDGDPRPLSPAADLTAYRVLQESLTNALRHGDGSAAAVSVRWSDDHVELEVTNPVGPATVTVGGTGVEGMRTRVEDGGGMFEAGPRGPVFVVRARMPVEAAP